MSTQLQHQQIASDSLQCTDCITFQNVKGSKLLCLASPCAVDLYRDVCSRCSILCLSSVQVRESPGLASSGSCMFVLAHLARTPAGREQLRAQGVLAFVLR
jgi:hypothetical protein